MTREQRAEQLRRAIQMFAQSLTDTEAMEIACVYPPYHIGKAYAVNDLFIYGASSVGDPQLYRVLQAHTSQEDWLPDSTAALYKAVGITPSGYPEWSQPVGAADAYSKGDIVSYNGKLYICTSDNNVYAPGVHGWDEYTGGQA